jgi:hypothetical protein
MITGIQGEFRGQGERVSITTNPITKNWMMSVEGNKAGAGFTATCLPFDQHIHVLDSAHAAATPDGLTHVRWSTNGTFGVGTWRIQSTNGTTHFRAPNASVPNTLEDTIVGTRRDQVQVCAVFQNGGTECSPWMTPEDATRPTHFDITAADVTATGWGQGMAGGVSAIPWAQGARIADAFCVGLGYTGGQLNGFENVGVVTGVVCYGDNATIHETNIEQDPSQSPWHFDGINVVPWAQAAREAADLCAKTPNVIPYGMFNGNESGDGRKTVALVCNGAPAQGFNATYDQVRRVGGNFSHTAPTRLDDVTWSSAARAAESWCRACAANGWCSPSSGQTFTSGRFNGYYSDDLVGLVCY